MNSELSLVTKEYIVFFLYLFLVIAYGIIESLWLQRIHSTSHARALLFTLLTNLIGFCTGFALVFISVGVRLAGAWDSLMEKLPYKGNETFGVLILLILALPFALMLIKRVGLTFFRVPGRRAWKFSLASSVLFWLVPSAITVFVGWLLHRFS